MIVLGFDTATVATAVGLRLADGTIFQARDDPAEGTRPGHATRLLPLASGLLAEASIGWAQIERIAVGVGPGTFTGLRIGVATARGLAQSLGVGLVGVSSVAALAHAAADDAAARGAGVLCAIDARRGEVFAAVYCPHDNEILPPTPIAPHELDALLARAEVHTGMERWIAVGDGVLRYREAFAHPGLHIPDSRSSLHRVDAKAICALGECGVAGDPAMVVPDYLRRPDAELALQGTGS